MPRFPACCRSSTGIASSRRSGPGSGSTPRSICSASSTARIISIPTCRPAIRSRNISSRSSGAAGSCSTCRTARRARSASPGSISNRMPARACTTSTRRETYVDLNRAGIGLMEIVSEPDLRSAEEAGLYLRKLRSILRYLGTCDGNMEEGSLRCDCNVSVRRPGEPYGTRCEIKNVNSVRFVMQAIEYEARRQIELIEEGGAVEQQTRLFDSGRGVTRPMRSKEHAHDYRYFPDPDLLPLELDPEWVERLRAELPELPDAKRARFVAEYGLRPEDADVLVAERATAEYFEKVADRARPEGGGELGRRRSVRGAQPARARHRAIPGRAGAARRADRPDRRRHDLRPDRQGCVRRDGRDRRGAGRDRRAQGAAPGQRFRRDRGSGRCRARRQPGAGRAIPHATRRCSASLSGRS